MLKKKKIDKGRVKIEIFYLENVSRMKEESG